MDLILLSPHNSIHEPVAKCVTALNAEYSLKASRSTGFMRLCRVPLIRGDDVESLLHRILSAVPIRVADAMMVTSEDSIVTVNQFNDRLLLVTFACHGVMKDGVKYILLDDVHNGYNLIPFVVVVSAVLYHCYRIGRVNVIFLDMMCDKMRGESTEPPISMYARPEFKQYSVPYPVDLLFNENLRPSETRVAIFRAVKPDGYYYWKYLNVGVGGRVADNEFTDMLGAYTSAYIEHVRSSGSTNVMSITHDYFIDPRYWNQLDYFGRHLRRDGMYTYIACLANGQSLAFETKDRDSRRVLVNRDDLISNLKSRAMSMLDFVGLDSRKSVVAIVHGMGLFMSVRDVLNEHSLLWYIANFLRSTRAEILPSPLSQFIQAKIDRLEEMKIPTLRIGNIVQDQSDWSFEPDIVPTYVSRDVLPYVTSKNSDLTRHAITEIMIEFDGRADFPMSSLEELKLFLGDEPLDLSSAREHECTALCPTHSEPTINKTKSHKLKLLKPPATVPRPGHPLYTTTWVPKPHEPSTSKSSGR